MNTILIIDDDSLYQMLLKKVIRKIDGMLNIISHHNGEDGLLYLKECIATNSEIPDMILLDINMPVIDGWQFLEEFDTIKSGLTKKINIYMISSSLDENDNQRASTNHNVTGFLIKPISSLILGNAIKESVS